MKSLYDFLLMEAKAEDFGKGFQDVSLRGALSKEAEGILQFSSYKKATAAAADSKNWEKVKKGLEVKGQVDTSDPMKFVKSFFIANSKLTEFIDFRRDDKGDDKMVQLSLMGDWRIVGGKEKLASSVKVLRFWIESTMTVYGIDTKKIGFAIHKDIQKMVVYKK